MTIDISSYDILECDPKPTPLGQARRIRIHRVDMRPMTFAELWAVFDAAYPGRWALQAFPPKDELIDQANKYHLWLLDERPECFNLMRR